MKKPVVLCAVVVTALLLITSAAGCQQEPEPVTPSKGPTRLAIMVASNTVEAGSSFMVAGSNFKPEEFVFAEFEYRFSGGRAGCSAHDEADEQGLVHIRIEVPEDIVPGGYEVKIYAGSTLAVKDRHLLTILPIHVEAVQ
jgi:hypothetical protein